jgi:hypothetical protein
VTSPPRSTSTTSTPRDEDVFVLRAASERDHRIVFDDEPRIGLPSFGDGSVKRTLQRPDLAVRAAPEITKLGGCHVPC